MTSRGPITHETVRLLLFLALVMLVLILAPSGVSTVTVSAAPMQAATFRAYLPLMQSSAPGSAAPTTYTLGPVADAFVDSAYPSTNFGTSTELGTQAASAETIRSLLRFSVSGVSGTITSAKLKLYANSTDSTGYEVFQVSDNTWTETGVTYANAPAQLNYLGQSGAVVAGSWYTVDVTAWVTGKTLVSFGLRNYTSTPVSLGSRESTQRPQLLLTTSNSTATTPVPSPTLAPVSGTCETRGSWINDYALPLGDTLLDRLQQAHLNTVFVLIPPVGGNNGWSDPTLFATFTAHAKARGLSVHGWIATMFRTSSVDFTSTTEQQAQANWALSLLKAYPYLDGVHLDYIRYGSYADVTASQLNGVNATVAAVHTAVKTAYPGKSVSAAVFTDNPRWANFATEAIPQWFREYTAANPGSVYGTSNVPQGMKYQQDPVGWVRAGNAEAIAPMEYAQSDATWNQDASAWQSLLAFQLPNAAKLYMGLPWYKQDPTTGDGGYDPASVARKVQYGQSIGVKGYVVFELGSKNSDGTYHDDSPLINALTVASSINNYKPPFAATAPSCLPAR